MNIYKLVGLAMFASVCFIAGFLFNDAVAKYFEAERKIQREAFEQGYDLLILTSDAQDLNTIKGVKDMDNLKYIIDLKSQFLLRKMNRLEEKYSNSFTHTNTELFDMDKELIELTIKCKYGRDGGQCKKMSSGLSK